ncbi:uncharacterized protein BDZ99DRAFT_469028 [Mytilinidion resinicola]|uniref:VHS domain-containing protein n=1 Tax=Mytilinidion resinicola TaxID=574789 RepID=A0A6A6Y160_9PEZI|nr:uncharacterized protein BDZ99DRAFT_469028 [Mytilinidion resinicola]KAF2802253.1 hypothetical protein BDZ99DRAFT_469028 [Mytilinidion resinicola]
MPPVFRANVCSNVACTSHPVFLEFSSPSPLLPMALVISSCNQPTCSPASTSPPPPPYKPRCPRPQDPPPYSKKPSALKPKSQPKTVSKSKPIHHHKRSTKDVPIFQNPCPLCFFEYLRNALNSWVKSQRKPYSAVTVQIDRLTSEQYEENDLGGIVDLIEVIRIQESGPTEAARAIRKKLKYGSVHRQIRALTILDGLIQNAGSRFQRAFADEPLLERLRLLAKDDMVDSEVRKKVNVLFRQWAVAYKSTPGLERIAALYKQLPRTKRPQPQQSKVLRENEAEAEHDEPTGPPSPTKFRRTSSPPTPSHTHTPSASASVSRPVALGSVPLPSSSIFKKDKKGKNKPFNLEKEKPQLLETIAQASVASTNLLNGLQLINREEQQVSTNPEVMSRFETCKVLRRRILRYIQLVESDQWIGSLLSANDELVKALMAFEIMDKSIEDDSDSENEGPYEEMPGSPTKGRANSRAAETAFAGLSLNEAAPAKPLRPTSIPMPAPPPYSSGKQTAQSDSEPEEEDFDEDNPFSDSNAVKTPHVEKTGMHWRGL